MSAFAGKSSGCMGDMEPLGEPLVPADLDLRNFPFMPLDVVRLIDSDLAAIASGEEFKAAVMLWCKAWHQVPASSLPDDDRLLARLSGFGRDVKGWLKVRELALRGFVKCSDGRLYHAVIAEKARDAGVAKAHHASEREGNQDRKRREREKRSRMFAQLEEVGTTPPWNVRTRDLRQMVRDLSQQDSGAGHTAVTVPVVPVTPSVTPNVAARTGTRTETETEIGIKEEDADRARKKATFERTEIALHAVHELADHPVRTAPVIAPILKLVIDEGFDLDTQIIPSVRRQALTARKPIKGWGYFVDGIRQDAQTSPPSSGARNGSHPARRKSPTEQLRDAFDRVEAHIAGRDTGS